MIRYQLLKPLVIPVIAILLSVIVSLKASAQNAKVIGIDHTSIVVRNLDSAAAMFKQLGFALKPGRFHNIHKKNTFHPSKQVVHSINMVIYIQRAFNETEIVN